MTIEAIKKLREAQPFVPFEMHLADGRIFPVVHQDFLWLVPNGRTLVVAQPGEEGFDILDVRLVASLHVKSGAAMNGGD